MPIGEAASRRNHKMRILDRRWQDGFLDEALTPGTCRVRCHVWANVRKLGGQYFERPRSISVLIAYYRSVGLRNTLRKVLSRRQERLRNEKWLSVGRGVIVESAPGCPWPLGTPVEFVAPGHPRCMERVVLPWEMINGQPAQAGPPRRGLLYGKVPVETGMTLGGLPGWAKMSGIPSDAASTGSLLSALRNAELKQRRHMRVGTPIREVSSARRRPSRKPLTTLVGYGNYAKTVILPNVSPHLNVNRIHEIDPTQIGARPRPIVQWDTSPTLRADESPDVVIVAGYHHTHAELAATALERGAVVILEKPLATTSGQLQRLAQALRSRDARLFACFQRRYSTFSEYVQDDIGPDGTNPVDYYCVVYEEPLPALHWYRWPVSRSRLVSNGCHWVDHFLYLNRWSPVIGSEATVSHSGALAVTLELENGAHFTMALSDRGSSRVGLQDTIELRSNDVTIRIENSERYRAERRDRVVRRANGQRLEAHARMYREIVRRIIGGVPGDSPESVVMSAAATLALENQVRKVGSH